MVSAGRGSDEVHGDRGRDRLEGLAGDDVLYGGPGEDRMQGYSGADRIHGGPGLDSAELSGDGDSVAATVEAVGYSTAPGGVTVDLETGIGRVAGSDAFDRIGGAYDLEGTRFADVLRGDDRPNAIGGRRGNDVVEGRAGQDVLRGGWGADHLDGGPGDDTLDGGTGEADVCIDGEERVGCEVLSER